MVSLAQKTSETTIQAVLLPTGAFFRAIVTMCWKALARETHGVC